MAGFLLRRLVLGLVALFVALSGSFFFFASQYLPLRSTPLLHAYWVWLRGVPSGRSLSHGLYGPILWPVLTAFERTLALLGLTLVFVLVVAVALGCVAAARRGSALDLVLRTGSYVAWAVPGFVLAIVLQQALGRIAGGWGLGWFPAVGWAGECPGGQGIDLHTFRCPAAGTGLTHVGTVLYHLTLPAVALAVGFVGLHARYLRNSLLDALDAPYITVARAKGLPERAVLLRHALRNALVTFVPAVLSDFGAIFGAALVVDVVFGLRGLGAVFIGQLHLNVDATVPMEIYGMQLLLLIGGALVLTASLLGEVVVVLLDPRTRPD